MMVPLNPLLRSSVACGSTMCDWLSARLLLPSFSVPFRMAVLPRRSVVFSCQYNNINNGDYGYRQIMFTADVIILKRV